MSIDLKSHHGNACEMTSEDKWMGVGNLCVSWQLSHLYTCTKNFSRLPQNPECHWSTQYHFDQSVIISTNPLSSVRENNLISKTSI